MAHNNEKKYLWVCHCNQANEALKKLHMWPSITDCTKEVHFIRLHCGGFCCAVIWVQRSVILQQWMLTMPQLSDGLRGRLLSPAGWDFHSYPDCAKICWEKLNTSHSSCHPFTSLFISYSCISDHALQGQELQFPLHFSCVCGNVGPTPVKHLCTATM